MHLGRVGIWVSSRDWPDDEARTAAAASELDTLGYRAVWLGSAPGNLDLPEKLLAATRRLVVATGIVNIWRAPADAVADAYHRVASAHPDRLLLGIGVGHATFAESIGKRYERPYHRLVEYLDRLDAATPPVPRSGRVLAALGPRVLALAGERTAGAHPYLVTPEHTRMARGILGDGPLLAPEQKVVLLTDPDRARAVARRTLATYLELPNYTANLRRLGFTDDDIAPPGTDRLVDALVAWGDTDTVVERVAAHHDAGADHVCVQVLTEAGGLPLDEWRELAAALPL